MAFSDLGYVLHTHPFQDNKTIAVVFSQQQGMQRIVFQTGKTFKKQPSLKSFLQPFQPLWLTWRGDKELKTGKEVEITGQRHNLAGKLLYCGFYLNELLVRLLPSEEVITSLFELYQTTLVSLVNQPEQLEVNLRQFEFSLLAELGYGLVFDCDYEGNPIKPKEYYVFIPDQGFCLHDNFSGSLTKIAHLFLGEDLLALARQQWSTQVKRSAKQIARQALTPLLGNKPLMSRQLFYTLRN